MQAEEGQLNFYPSSTNECRNELIKIEEDPLNEDVSSSVVSENMLVAQSNYSKVEFQEDRNNLHLKPFLSKESNSDKYENYPYHITSTSSIDKGGNTFL